MYSITKWSRIATTNTAAAEEEKVPLLSLCLVGQTKMFRHESAVRDEKVDHRIFSQCVSPSSLCWASTHPPSFSAVVCPTNNILPWKLQYNMLFTVSVLLNVEHTKEKSGTYAPQGSSNACSKNVLSYLFFDFENNHRYEPVERFTTPHPVKQQTLEVSGLSDGCKGRDWGNGRGARTYCVNPLQPKCSGSVHDTAAGVWLPYRRASAFLSCLCSRGESCSIHGLDSQKTSSNLSINTPSFLCPRPRLTSDVSRLSARAS